MKLDRALVLAVVRPIIYGKIKRDSRAVEGIERIVEAEAMSGREFRASVQNLVEEVAENRRGAPVHGVDRRGFGNRLHSKVVQPRLVVQKSVADFPQGVLTGNLRVQAGEELPPDGKMLAMKLKAANRKFAAVTPPIRECRCRERSGTMFKNAIILEAGHIYTKSGNVG